MVGEFHGVAAARCGSLDFPFHVKASETAATDLFNTEYGNG